MAYFIHTLSRFYTAAGQNPEIIPWAGIVFKKINLLGHGRNEDLKCTLYAWVRFLSGIYVYLL